MEEEEKDQQQEEQHEEDQQQEELEREQAVAAVQVKEEALSQQGQQHEAPVPETAAAETAETAAETTPDSAAASALDGIVAFLEPVPLPATAAEGGTAAPGGLETTELLLKPVRLQEGVPAVLGRGNANTLASVLSVESHAKAIKRISRGHVQVTLRRCKTSPGCACCCGSRCRASEPAAGDSADTCHCQWELQVLQLSPNQCCLFAPLEPPPERGCAGGDGACRSDQQGFPDPAQQVSQQPPQSLKKGASMGLKHGGLLQLHPALQCAFRLQVQVQVPAQVQVQGVVPVAAAGQGRAETALAVPAATAATGESAAVPAAAAAAASARVAVKLERQPRRQGQEQEPSLSNSTADTNKRLAAVKRKRAVRSPAQMPPAQPPAAGDAGGGEGGAEAARWEEKALKRMKVAELRAVCEERGLVLTGRVLKADMINRLMLQPDAGSAAGE